MENTNPDTQQNESSVKDVFDIGGTDEQIIESLTARINRSKARYDSDRQYKLGTRRKKNKQLLWGEHYEAGTYETLFSHSIRYTEPQIYVGIQTIIAFITDRLHEVEARPGNESSTAIMLARDFASFAEEHGTEVGLKEMLVRMLYSLMTDRVGVIKWVWDPTYNNGIGELLPRQIDPKKIVFEFEAGLDENPGFIAEEITQPLSKILQAYPECKQNILTALDIKEGDLKKYLHVRYSRWEVWLTGQSPDGLEEEEQLVVFMPVMKDKCLIKTRNPHWLYDVEAESIGNVLPLPPKPYLTINLLNDGSNKVDQKSLIELVEDLQHALNKRKRSIGEQAMRWAGLKVWSEDAVTTDDVEELTGQPDESIVVKGTDVNKSVIKVAPDFIPEYMFRDATEIREIIHDILGTPPSMRGAVTKNDTLGQDIMERDQSQGRHSPLAGALDAFMTRYYRMYQHLAKVYYTKKHHQIRSGENGTFDFIMMRRDLIVDGQDVRARAGSSLAPDEARWLNMAFKMADRISTLDLYRLAKFPHPEEMYERWVKEKVDASLVVKDLNLDEGDRTAKMDYELAKAGEPVPPREDPQPGHIDTHREQIASDDFINGTNQDGTPTWTPETRQAFLEHVQSEIESLARRAESMARKAEAMQAEQPNPMALPGGAPAPGMPGNVAATPQNPAPMAIGRR